MELELLKAELRHTRICFVVMTLCASVFLGLYLYTNGLPFHHTSSQVVTDIKDCYNLSLEGSANCLKDYISRYYNYTPTLDNAYRSFEDIKLNGGDCYDYSRWYQYLGEDLGFYSKKISFDINESNAHAVTIISNQSGYCVLDQLNVKCMRFG